MLAALKTILLSALLLLFAIPLPRGAADEWISEEYRCALTIPTQESWTPALRQALPFGEVIFHAVSMTSSQGMMITYVAEMPSSDIRNPAVLKRVNELLAAQGWSVESSSQIVWKNRPYIQFISERRDVVAGKLIGVSRITPRGRSLYVLTAYGKGEANRAEDPEFMRVMETFRFVEQSAATVHQPEGPSVNSYRLAMFGTGTGAAVLFCAFVVVMLLIRQAQKEDA